MSFWIFGKSKTPKELLRENQRMLKRAVRDIDRERAKLQMQEKQLIRDIKQMATKGQMGAARIMARDLVRTRHHITSFYTLKSHLQAISLRMQTLQSHQAMGDSMKGATRAMMAMNRRMNLPAMQHILANFEMQSQRMNMKQEMMEDALDDMFEAEDEEEATDEILDQVLDEIGINLSSELVDAPATTEASGVAQKKVAAKGVEVGGSIGGGGGGSGSGSGSGGGSSGFGGGGGGLSSFSPSAGGSNSGDPADDALQARLDNLKKK